MTLSFFNLANSVASQGDGFSLRQPSPPEASPKTLIQAMELDLAHRHLAVSLMLRAFAHLHQYFKQIITTDLTHQMAYLPAKNQRR
jgi:hypothetical protein